MPDLLETSAATWRENRHESPTLPPELTVPPRDASTGTRIRALRTRHRVRRERAEGVYAQSRNPARGWPVADEHAVVRFVARMIRERGRSFTSLVVLNALAAVAALAVPRLLGQL